MTKDPWDVPAWRDNCEALQAELVALLKKAEGLGCSLEVLTIVDGSTEAATCPIPMRSAGEMPDADGEWVRFFPDPWLLEEVGTVPDEICEEYGK
jgi:hypothetical protein